MVAVSFTKANEWIANDIYRHLERLGINAYVYTIKPDSVHDLTKELEQKYIRSVLNVIVISPEYIDKLKQTDSFIHKENKIIQEQYNINSRSIFLISEDGLLHPNYKFTTTFNINDLGLIHIAEMIQTQYIKNYQFNTECIYDMVTHPFCAQHRGQLSPCKFSIIKDAMNSKNSVIGNRWRKYGDIAVKIIDHRIQDNDLVFLIPSGKVPTHLVHTNLLNHNNAARSIKKTASITFIRHYESEEFIDGWIFEEITRDDRRYKMIYSIQYDQWLYNYLSSHNWNN